MERIISWRALLFPEFWESLDVSWSAAVPPLSCGALSVLFPPPASAVAPMSCPPAGRLPPAFASASVVGGVPPPADAIFLPCCVCLPPHS
ncbi:MAG: hypothetical protein ACK56F_29065, partial [bacterium]